MFWFFVAIVVDAVFVVAAISLTFAPTTTVAIPTAVVASFLLFLS